MECLVVNSPPPPPPRNEEGSAPQFFVPKRKTAAPRGAPTPSQYLGCPSGFREAWLPFKGVCGNVELTACVRTF